MNPIKTYSKTYTKLQYAALPIETRLAALPADEREMIEAMVTALVKELRGVGRQTALEVIWAAGRWARGLGRVTK